MEAKPEAAIISEVADRVRDHVPEQRRGAVDSVVQDLWREYCDARVRDFVPIFVERDALARLAARRS